MFETERIKQPPKIYTAEKNREIYAPRGDGWTCLRRATCSSVSALISPRELEGGQFGWVVRSRRGRVGCIAGDPRAAITNKDESETTRRRGPGVLHVESTKYGATLLTGGDRSSKQETSTRSLLPPHFKILVSFLFKTNHIFNCAAPDNSILILIFYESGQSFLLKCQTAKFYISFYFQAAKL